MLFGTASPRLARMQERARGSRSRKSRMIPWTRRQEERKAPPPAAASIASRRSASVMRDARRSAPAKRAPQADDNHDSRSQHQRSEDEAHNAPPDVTTLG